MMDNTLMKEIDAIQIDMTCMEGMLEALIKGAYAGTRVEYIGNSLEILKDYLGQRVERLDKVCSPYLERLGEADAATRESLSDICTRWEGFIAGNGNRFLQSEEVGEAYRKAAPYLELLPDEKNRELGLLLKEIGAASRQQGFTEGFRAAAGERKQAREALG